MEKYLKNCSKSKDVPGCCFRNALGSALPLQASVSVVPNVPPQTLDLRMSGHAVAQSQGLVLLAILSFKFFISSVNSKLQAGSQAVSSWCGNWESPTLMFPALAGADRLQRTRGQASSAPSLSAPIQPHMAQPHLPAQTGPAPTVILGLTVSAFPKEKA